MQSEAHDITRIVLFVLVIGALLVGSAWTLLPFLNGLIWATTITVATWPTLLRVQRLTGGRRAPAVAIMTLLILLVFMLPFAFAVSTLLDAANRSPAVMHDFLARGLGPPPAWIPSIPVIGARIADRWQSIAAGGPEGLLGFVEPYARAAAVWAIAATGGFGRMVILILLTIILVAILYSQGETAGRGALAFANRLGGETGQRTLRLAGQAIRSVALGVVLTALIQSLLAGLGLYLCGIPHPGLLTAFIFVLGIAQLGPLPVMVPSIAWLYWTGSTGAATALLIWSLPVGTLDNVIRPILIRRGVQLPLLLIVAGVIGGLIGFGVVGLFVGPVILAATYTLAKDWVARGSVGDGGELTRNCRRTWALGATRDWLVRRGRKRMSRMAVVTGILASVCIRTASASAQGWQPPAETERCPSKWGAGDERGAANLMKPEVVLRAARLIKTGEVIELGYPLFAGMPFYGDRVFNQQLKRTNWPPGSNHRGANEEIVTTELGQVGTQIDGFAHQSIGNVLYNCFKMDELATRTGFTKLGIEHAGGLFTRGVLVDVAALRGVEMLGDRYEVTARDLQDALERQRLTLEPGDAIIINTGFGRLWGHDDVRYYRTQPGLGVGAAEWLATQNPMIVASDTCCIEVNPNPDPNLSSPVHQILLVSSGIYLMESLKLDELLQKGIYEFAFIVEPLKLKGATGSSVAPIAVR